MNKLSPLASCLVLAAACASSGPQEAPETGPPEAAPLARDQARSAREAPAAPAGPASGSRSTTRVLAYVDGEVVTYRDVLLRIGPQLAVLEGEQERDRLEQKELLDIVMDRVLDRAAREAAVVATRDEVDAERERRLADLRREGGALEAYLAERGMTRRELDESIRRDLVRRKYLLAAIGRNVDPRVRVRAVTDTYVSPAEVRKYYDRHPERFREPATASYRMLAVGTDLAAPDLKAAVAAARAKAEAALARLQAGEDWVPVFRSTVGAGEPDAPDGLSRVRRGQKPPWIDEFAFSRPKGELSPVIEIGTTFYLLRAEGSHGERTVPFEEVQANVREVLGDVRRRMAGYEVQLSLLDESSVRPEDLKARLRDSLRAARHKLMQEVGL